MRPRGRAGGVVPSGGRFAVTLDASNLGEDGHTVWGRACLGPDCGVLAVDVPR